MKLKDNENKVLTLYKILCEHTDEEHHLNTKQILKLMQENGYTCSEDSISRYLKQLSKELDLDIIHIRGRNGGYYIGSRLFDIEELKLIIDSINSSNVIEKSIAERMINKLKSLISNYASRELERNILAPSVAKAENKKILYSVNIIQEAIRNNKQISFYNLVWNEKKELVRKSDRKNTFSPWALVWAYDRYYLYGYDVKEKEGKFTERNYRVDKLDEIEILNEDRTGEEQYKEFEPDNYVSRRLWMFSDEEMLITVEINKQLIGAFIDQFGKSAIMITKILDEKVELNFKAEASDMLIGWLIGMKGVKVLGPIDFVDKTKELILNNAQKYNYD